MQACCRQTAQAIWNDMEQNRLVSDIGFANSLAERKMEAIVAKEASIRMKNLPTIMTCTPTSRKLKKLLDGEVVSLV